MRHASSCLRLCGALQSVVVDVITSSLPEGVRTTRVATTRTALFRAFAYLRGQLPKELKHFLLSSHSRLGISYTRRRTDDRSVVRDLKVTAGFPSMTVLVLMPCSATQHSSIDGTSFSLSPQLFLSASDHASPANLCSLLIRAGSAFLYVQLQCCTAAWFLSPRLAPDTSYAYENASSTSGVTIRHHLLWLVRRSASSHKPQMSTEPFFSTPVLSNFDRLSRLERANHELSCRRVADHAVSGCSWGTVTSTLS